VCVKRVLNVDYLLGFGGVWMWAVLPPIWRNMCPYFEVHRVRNDSKKYKEAHRQNKEHPHNS